MQNKEQQMQKHLGIWCDEADDGHLYDSAEIRNLLLILLHCELDFHFLVNCENV